MMRLRSPEVATALHQWFFPQVAVSNTSTVTSGFAAVSTGWTGSISIGSGATVGTFTPADASSVVEVLDAVCRRASRVLGSAITWSISTDGVVTLTSTVPFQLLASGSVRTRLGFLGVHAGQASYTAETAAHVTSIPSLGLNLDDALEGRSGAQVTALGGAVVGLSRTWDSGALTIYGAYDELCDLADELDDLTTLDVALGGSWGGRVRVEAVSRVPWTETRTDKATIEVEVQGVTR